MTKSQKIEDLMRPSDAAEKLGISVATLRKYSLIVEDVTNEDYFVRTKQKTRLYSEQNVADLRNFQELSKNSSLTLKEAAKQVYTMDKVVAAAAGENEDIVEQNQAVAILKQKIIEQDKQIEALKAELAELKQATPEKVELVAVGEIKDGPVDTSIAEMPVDEDFIDDLPDLEEVEQARAEMNIETAGAEETDPRQQILAKAEENFAENGANEHRTLADMQVQDEKKHWWQRIINKQK